MLLQLETTIRSIHPYPHKPTTDYESALPARHGGIGRTGKRETQAQNRQKMEDHASTLKASLPRYLNRAMAFHRRKACLAGSPPYLSRNMASPSIKVHFIALDVRVFNPHGPLQQGYQPPKKHERIKKNAYEQCVREVEHATFTSIVLAATGGMAKEAETSLLATKNHYTTQHLHGLNADFVSLY